MATSTLASLKFTTAKKPAQLPAVEVRRSKLVLRIGEQIMLATAIADGRTYAPVKLKTVTDADGNRVSAESAKRVKQWWFTTDNGKIALTVRYGAKVLELVKGKNAIEVASPAQLVATLQVIKSAAENGELDAAIEAASTVLRAGFSK